MVLAVRNFDRDADETIMYIIAKHVRQPPQRRISIWMPQAIRVCRHQHALHKRLLCTKAE